MGKTMAILRHRTFFFLIILSSIVTACQLESRMLLPTPLPTKAFLPNVYPEPSGRIAYEDYKANLDGENLQVRDFGPICVTYVAEEVLEYGDDRLNMEDYLSRSVLIVDYEVWPKGTEPISSEPLQYEMSYFCTYVGFRPTNPVILWPG